MSSQELQSFLDSFGIRRYRIIEKGFEIYLLLPCNQFSLGIILNILRLRLPPSIRLYCKKLKWWQCRLNKKQVFNKGESLPEIYVG